MLIYLEFFLLANLLLTSYLILYLQGGQAVHLVPVHAVDRLQPQLALLQVALVEELVRDEPRHLLLDGPGGDSTGKFWLQFRLKKRIEIPF